MRGVWCGMSSSMVGSGGQLTSGRGAVSPAYWCCSVPQHLPLACIGDRWKALVMVQLYGVVAVVVAVLVVEEVVCDQLLCCRCFIKLMMVVAAAVGATGCGGSSFSGVNREITYSAVRHFLCFSCVHLYRCIAVSPCRRVAVSPCRRAAVPPCRRAAVSPCRRAAVSPCRRVAVSLCRCVVVSLSGLSGVCVCVCVCVCVRVCVCVCESYLHY